MTVQDWVLIIGSIGTNLVAVIGAFTILYAKLKTNTKLTEENHDMMNSERDNAATYRRQLVDVLKEHDITIPRDKSIKEPKTVPLPETND